MRRSFSKRQTEHFPFSFFCGGQPVRSLLRSRVKRAGCHLHNRLCHGHKEQHCSSLGIGPCSQPQGNCFSESSFSSLGTSLGSFLGLLRLDEVQSSVCTPSLGPFAHSTIYGFWLGCKPLRTILILSLGTRCSALPQTLLQMQILCLCLTHPAALELLEKAFFSSFLCAVVWWGWAESSLHECNWFKENQEADLLGPCPLAWTLWFHVCKCTKNLFYWGFDNIFEVKCGRGKRFERVSSRNKWNLPAVVFLLVCAAGDQFQGLVSTKEVLYYWAKKSSVSQLWSPKERPEFHQPSLLGTWRFWSAVEVLGSISLRDCKEPSAPESSEKLDKNSYFCLFSK